MTGIVLALAGLAAGDGEPGLGAAHEPVKIAVDFGKGFRGHIRLPGGPLCQVWVDASGYLTFRNYSEVTVPGLKLSPSGESGFRVTGGGDVLAGTVSIDRQGIILTLNPVPIEGDDHLPNLIRGISRPRHRNP
jgi:hypothetical protein